MKLHNKIFIISLLALIAGAIIYETTENTLSEAVLTQARAISYFVTLAGIASTFSWYKNTVLKIDLEDANHDKIVDEKGKKVFRMMLIFNIINAIIISVASDPSIHFMAGISLLIIPMTPRIITNINEKEPES
jgi:hypothetical protein